jgi:drug/metabolite transporter (DMT)-like permease
MSSKHPSATSLLPAAHQEALGLFFGFVGVLVFSFSLPLTRIAVRDLDPTFVGLGRALIAALLSGLTLFWARQPLPSRRQIQRLAIVAFGVVVGFPVFSAWSLRFVPAAYGSVITALLPLSTAVVSVLVSGDRPSPRFWLASLIGSLTVIVFVVASRGGGFTIGALAMLGAVLMAAIGYVEGGRLAKEIGSWQTICWANLLSAPLLIWPVGASVLQHGLAASPGSWAAFLYLGVFSMFLGFFAWYRGLALGGITRVSQVQLIQPLLSLVWSALLLGEQLTLLMLVAAAVVVACIYVARKAPIAIKQATTAGPTGAARGR